jgi:antiviral defense system Shedu protein SduA
VTGFLIAEPGSTGLTGYAVELERPQAKIFTAKGDPSAALTHALRQIDDWRDWLSRSRDYASRPREQSGLGLPDIDSELDGLVIMGRDARLDLHSHGPRRRLQRQHRVRIETYDWLANQARSHLAALERSRSARDNSQQGVRGASPEDTPNSTELVRDAGDCK